MSLSVLDITKTYGNQNAVDGLSFSVEGGQIMGFLGPNGAGKSTTMKMVSCYIAPTSGTATVCGYDILESPLDVRKNIGYLPEQNPLYFNMYVKEYLNFVAGLHKMNNKNAVVSNLIEKVGLGKEQHKLIGSLSKGYKQRVGIAQAIIHEPKVLILDEPTSGLDMNQLVDIRNLIKQLGEENTVILSTHIMQEVEALCDRVIIINNGKLIADDPIDQLQQRIKGEEKTTIILAEKNIDLNAFSSIDGVINAHQNGNQIVIISDGKRDTRPDIFRKVVEHNWTILEMNREKGNVEDIFQKLTKSSAHV